MAKAISDAKLTTEEGKPVYGSCISKKRGAQAYWFISSIAGSYIQSQGTSQGGFFDLDGFKPLVNNEAFAKALDIYKESTKFGPPDELNLDVGDTRGLFTAGQCGLGLDWGDIGTLAIDKATSKVIDKVEVLRSGRVRRAKLFYLRKKKGKSARLKDRSSNASAE